MKTFNLGSRGLAVGVIGALSVVVGGIGVAAASNGGSMLLGHHNTATKTTTLTDKHGTPLALIGKKTKPPLKVNSSRLVKHFNAAELGGATSNDLSTGSGAHLDFDLLAVATSGGGGIRAITLPHTVPSGSDIQYFPILLARTGALPAGTYSVNANAISTPGVPCFLGTNGTFAGSHQNGIQGLADTTAEFIQNLMTDYLTVTKGQRIGLYCLDTDDTDPAYVLSDALSATRVNHSIKGQQTPSQVISAVKLRKAAH